MNQLKFSKLLLLISTQQTYYNFGFTNIYKALDMLSIGSKSIKYLTKGTILNKKTFNQQEKAKSILLKSKFTFSKNVFKGILDQVLTHPYSRLCRWQKPIGALLLFWPCLWGIQAGANSLIAIQSFIPLYSLFLMGAWTSRSAGCIINDYLDKEFDRNVQRCKTRPLASGQVTTQQAAKLLFFNLCGGLIVLSQMNVIALLATFMILPIAALYPLAKRYIKYPQAILASAFNSGIFICALTVNPTLPSWQIIIPLYGSGICWTMIYDTIYGFQDIEDDKKLGLKNTAIQWQNSMHQKANQLLMASAILTCSLALFNPYYTYSIPIFIGAHWFLKMQLDKVDLKNRQSCGKFFKKNNIFGILIFFGLLFKRLIQENSLDQKLSDKLFKRKIN